MSVILTSGLLKIKKEGYKGKIIMGGLLIYMRKGIIGCWEWGNNNRKGAIEKLRMGIRKMCRYGVRLDNSPSCLFRVITKGAIRNWEGNKGNMYKGV